MSKRPNRFRSLLTALMLTVALLVTACGNSNSSNQATNDPSESSTTDTLAATPDETKEFAGYVRNPPLDVSEVTLPAADGTEITMVAQPGGIRLVYFGYTTCPDICPATLAYVEKALNGQSETDRAKVDVDMITIDPSVDSPEILSAYIQQFVPNGHAIHTMDPVLLRAAANTFGASYRIQYQDGKRVVAHTDDLYAVDDTGTVVLAWPFGHALAEVEQDLTRLLKGERPGDEIPEAVGASDNSTESAS